MSKDLELQPTAAGEPPAITIRPLRDDEKPTLRKLANRSFTTVFQGIFFEMTPHTLVAERNGTLLGAAVLKLFTLGGQQMGEVAWLFTAPEVRGSGVGQQLVDAGLAYLSERNAEFIFALVDGNNPSSFKQFTYRGFGRIAPFAQLRRFGLHLPQFWLRSGLAFAFSHFLYGRPTSPAAAGRWGHWLYVAGYHALVLAPLFLWLGASPGLYLPVLLLLLAVLAARALVMLGTARLLGLHAEFRAWEAASVLGLAGALWGGFWMLPGGVYPIGDQWRYAAERRRLGIVSFAGGLLVLLALWLLLLLAPAGPVAFAAAIGPLMALAIVDTGLPFVPSYNGHRVWLWSKSAWLVLVVLLAAALAWRFLA